MGIVIATRKAETHRLPHQYFGCCRKGKGDNMGKLIDLTGQRFGRLTVIEKAPAKQGCENAVWLCKCDCGNSSVVQSQSLRSGRTRSCGCYQKEKITKMLLVHGQAKGNQTRLYKIYHGIKNRCLKEKDPSYKRYGHKGITICEEWRNSFEAFYEWAMSHGYSDDLTIDRIDSNGNYCPENCRWVTYKVQNNNTSRNHLITYNGKTQTLAQWAEEMGIKYDTLSARINRSHWNIERALTTK